MSNSQIMSILVSLTAIVSKESAMSAKTRTLSRKLCVCGSGAICFKGR